MEKSIQPGVSPITRMVRIAVVWAAWIVAGAVTFDLPRLLHEKSDPMAAFAAAPQEAKIYITIWILGSVILCALFILTLRQAVGQNQKKP
ncbi:MAG: hypothetical protein P8X96_16275 [Desulfobacteraceae bacterium]|jgi:hypothetical protein